MRGNRGAPWPTHKSKARQRRRRRKAARKPHPQPGQLAHTTERENY